MFSQLAKVKAIPKVRHFLWRLCTSSLPVKGLLLSRHMIDSAYCPWCEDEIETAEHAFFNCWRVGELWDECGGQVLVSTVGSDSMCDMMVRWSNFEERLQRIGAYLMWNIWLERNKKIFENKTTPNRVIIERVNRQIEEWNKFSECIYTRPAANACKSSKI